jgi:hypothetical protein
MKTLIAASTMVLLSAGTAFAQDDTMGDGSSDSSSDSSSDGSMGGSMGGSMSSSDTGGGTAAADAQLGIETELNTAGASPVAHVLYNLGGNYLDAQLLFNIDNLAPDPGESTTILTFGVGVGYRMYKDMDGRIHPYLEPAVSFALSTDDTQGKPKTIGAGAELGVDFQLFDQFTLGAAVGAGLSYTFADGLNELQLGLHTTSINATFWWG